MRIPRKKKKKYKRIWEKKCNRRLIIYKHSIECKDNIWGCMVIPRQEHVKINY